MADREIEVLKDQLKRKIVAVDEMNRILNALLKHLNLTRGELLSSPPLEPENIRPPKKRKVKDDGFTND